jgi:hypothetical protein
MGTNKNKATRQNSNRKIVGAIKKHLSGTVTLAGVKYTTSKLAQVFQQGIDVSDATDVANKAWRTSVAKERATTQEISGVQTVLRNHVSALFGETSTEFADFGFTPKQVTPVDVATKVEAVEKRAATRVARHTMGKRQKKKITGETSPVVDTSTTPTAPEQAPAAASQTVVAPVKTS